MLNFKAFILGSLETNCYLIWDTLSSEALIIDPATPDNEVFNYISKAKLSILGIINTHGHADHIGGNGFFKERTSAPIFINPSDKQMLTEPSLNFSKFIFESIICSPPSDLDLTEKTPLHVGCLNVRIFETPGHSPGSICLLVSNHLFSGDTLFYNSVGRTDIPGGNSPQLIKNIKTKLLSLSDDVIIHPGHGVQSSIGLERKNNPFLRE